MYNCTKELIDNTIIITCKKDMHKLDGKPYRITYSTKYNPNPIPIYCPLCSKKLTDLDLQLQREKKKNQKEKRKTN